MLRISTLLEKQSSWICQKKFSEFLYHLVSQGTLESNLHEFKNRIPLVVILHYYCE